MYHFLAAVCSSGFKECGNKKQIIETGSNWESIHVATHRISKHPYCRQFISKS